MAGTEHVIDVWGDFACFTRPELKVERFSYPFITPSAARGIFDAIFAKPSRDPTQAQFRWQVTRIEILNPVSYIALRRNEVKEKAPSARTITAWMDGREEPAPILADADEAASGSDQKGRTQRQTMALRGVRYRLHARIVPWPGKEDRVRAFDAQFSRRVSAGKCFHQPCFGCREFPAFFEPAQGAARPTPWSQDDLGLMLYDVFDHSRPTGPDAPARVSLFRPTVNEGVVEVPPWESPDVLKPNGGGPQ